MSTNFTNPVLQTSLNTPSKDKFLLVFELPPILKQQSDLKEFTKPFEMKIFGNTSPEISVPETNVRFGGQSLNVSSYSRPSPTPLQFSFVVDNQYKNYYVFWRWLDVMNSAIDSVYNGRKTLSVAEKFEIGNKFEYQTDVTVYALDEYNNPALRFIYSKAFITQLGGLSYSYREAVPVESTATITFSQMDVSVYTSPII